MSVHVFHAYQFSETSFEVDLKGCSPDVSMTLSPAAFNSCISQHSNQLHLSRRDSVAGLFDAADDSLENDNDENRAPSVIRKPLINTHPHESRIQSNRRDSVAHFFDDNEDEDEEVDEEEGKGSPLASHSKKLQQHQLQQQEQQSKFGHHNEANNRRDSVACFFDENDDSIMSIVPSDVETPSNAHELDHLVYEDRKMPSSNRKVPLSMNSNRRDSVACFFEEKTMGTGEFKRMMEGMKNQGSAENEEEMDEDSSMDVVDHSLINNIPSVSDNVQQVNDNDDMTMDTMDMTRCFGGGIITASSLSSSNNAQKSDVSKTEDMDMDMSMSMDMPTRLEVDSPAPLKIATTPTRRKKISVLPSTEVLASPISSSALGLLDDFTPPEPIPTPTKINHSLNEPNLQPDLNQNSFSPNPSLSVPTKASSSSSITSALSSPIRTTRSSAAASMKHTPSLTPRIKAFMEKTSSSSSKAAPASTPSAKVSDISTTPTKKSSSSSRLSSSIPSSPLAPAATRSSPRLKHRKSLTGANSPLVKSSSPLSKSKSARSVSASSAAGLTPLRRAVLEANWAREVEVVVSASVSSSPLTGMSSPLKPEVQSSIDMISSDDNDEKTDALQEREVVESPILNGKIFIYFVLA